MQMNSLITARSFSVRWVVSFICRILSCVCVNMSLMKDENRCKVSTRPIRSTIRLSRTEICQFQGFLQSHSEYCYVRGFPENSGSQRKRKLTKMTYLDDPRHQLHFDIKFVQIPSLEKKYGFIVPKISMLPTWVTLSVHFSVHFFVSAPCFIHMGQKGVHFIFIAFKFCTIL